MWPRQFEIFFAIWLSISWLIFNYSNSLLMYHDFIVASLICTFSLLSYKYRYFNLLNLILSCWLMFFAFYSHAYIGDPLSQNYMVIGLLLVLFTAVPSHASHPPIEWQDFIRNKLD